MFVRLLGLGPIPCLARLHRASAARLASGRWEQGRRPVRDRRSFLACCFPLKRVSARNVRDLRPACFAFLRENFFSCCARVSLAFRLVLIPLGIRMRGLKYAALAATGLRGGSVVLGTNARRANRRRRLRLEDMLCKPCGFVKRVTRLYCGAL